MDIIDFVEFLDDGEDDLVHEMRTFKDRGDPFEVISRFKLDYLLFVLVFSSETLLLEVLPLRQAGSVTFFAFFYALSVENLVIMLSILYFPSIAFLKMHRIAHFRCTKTAPTRIGTDLRRTPSAD